MTAHTCRHCGRTITKDAEGVWVDPEATGDDSVWRETCDSHDTFTAKHEPAPLFEVGRLVATPAALEVLERNDPELVLILLSRHASGDWGDVDREDAAANTRAVTTGHRLVSSYDLGDGVKLWIITEADRSVTTVLLPSDY